MVFMASRTENEGDDSSLSDSESGHSELSDSEQSEAEITVCLLADNFYLGKDKQTRWDATSAKKCDMCKSGSYLTKGAVDVMDEMKASYSVSRISNFWSLTVFFTIMNIACVNSLIIYKCNTNDQIDRRTYIKNSVFGCHETSSNDESFHTHSSRPAGVPSQMGSWLASCGINHHQLKDFVAYDRDVKTSELRRIVPGVPF
ncbi:hypothetical protein PR048_016575 [Dryococelus australis]|uniref:PiggyBac transposable element-derived protein domain-containing protein n=1 Tax=Dryococelus australis TaxID=614101 RepID=A0ABQ9HK78_9NEOP|nr:hypothetical protein PR048_016575 [Dryococelus australis]